MQRVWSRVNCKIPDGVASFFCRVASRSVDFTISGGFRRQLAADLARVLSRSAYFGLVQSNKRIIRFRSLPVGGIARPLVALSFLYFVRKEMLWALCPMFIRRLTQFRLQLFFRDIVH